MSTAFNGHFFNALNLQSEPVAVAVSAGALTVTGPAGIRGYDLDRIRVSDRLGQVPRYLYLPDGASIETADHEAVEALFGSRRNRRLSATLHWLEQRSRVAAVATVLVVLGVAAIGYFGLPALARTAAAAVPPVVEQQVGRAALTAMSHHLRPSQMNETDRRRLMQQFLKLVECHRKSSAPHGHLSLHFYSMAGEHPNAFALPGGTVILSDELVALAETDEELAAVIAHEIGHVHHRHGVESILRGSAALLLISTVTGDLSTLTSFAASYPVLVLQRGYSREFEAEADEFARQLLQKAGISVRHYVTILAKLERVRGAQPHTASYLSTHPATTDRIRALDPAGEYAALVREVMARPEPKPQPAATGAPAPGEIASTGPGSQPRAIFQTEPEYPVHLSAQGVQGSVTIEFIVDASGNVQAPLVVESSHHGFEAPALAAVRQWKFVPGKIGTRSVGTRVRQTLTFSLSETAAKPPPARPTPLPIGR